MNLYDIMTGKTSRMSHVSRYSATSVHRKENIAEHSWWVAFISMIVADDLLSKGVDISLMKVMSRALVHDLDECLSGDIIRTFKYSNPALSEEIKIAAEQNMVDLTSGYGVSTGGWVRAMWLAAKEDTLEGQTVAFADMATVAFYCRQEDESGNRAIRPVLKEMYEGWFAEFHNHEHLGPYVEQMFPTGRWTDMIRVGSGMSAALMFPMVHDHSEGETSQPHYDEMGRTPLS